MVVLSIGPTLAKQDEGLAISRKSLTNEERLVSKIDNIEVDIVFEFPPTNPNYVDFWNDLTNFVASGAFEVRRRAVDKFGHPAPRLPFASKLGTNSLSEEDYIYQVPASVFAKVFGPPELVWMRIGFNRSKKSSSSLPEMLKQQTDWPDLTLDCVTNSIPGFCFYKPESKKLFAEWRGLKLTREFTSYKIAGITDLNECFMFFTVSNRYRDEANHPVLVELRPRWLNLRIDNLSVVLTNFVTLNEDRMYVVHEATLPTSEAILSGKTYTPNPYH